MKRIFVLIIGVLFLPVVHSIAIQLENIGFQVEMFYKCTKELNGGSGPQRTKGQQADCPVSVFVCSSENRLVLVGAEDNMTISFIIINELGEDVESGSVLNDSTTIDISSLEDGAYTLQIIVNNVNYCGIFDILSDI